MGDPGTGADIETQSHRTVPDLAVDVVAAETERTAEAEVGVREMVQPRPPPPKRTEILGRRSERTGRRYISVERRIDGDGILRVASRQAPTGETGAIHQAPTEVTIVGDGNLCAASRQELTGEARASHWLPT